MKRLAVFLLVVLFLLTPLSGIVSAKLDLTGACKVILLKNEKVLVQKGQYRRDGNHTCTSVDLYEYKDRDMVFVKTISCSAAEKLYQKYKGDDYVQPDKR